LNPKAETSPLAGDIGICYYRLLVNTTSLKKITDVVVDEVDGQWSLASGQLRMVILPV